MPPKKVPRKKSSLKDKSSTQNYKIKDVDREFFEIQFGAKEKTINRLKEEMIVMEKDLQDYDIKVKDLRIRTNNDCKDIRETLKKKYNLKKIRTAEIELLRQETNSMNVLNQNKLKTIDDKFNKEAGILKSNIAVYVGRLNKLNEFFKQERKLVRKHELMEDQIQVWIEQNKLKLLKIKELHIFSRYSIQIVMFKRFFDFVVHLKKQQVLYPAANSTDIHDIKDMLNRTKEWNANIENRYVEMKLGVKNNISLKRKRRENKISNYGEYLQRKNCINGLKNEINDIHGDISVLEEKLMKDSNHMNPAPKSLAIINSAERESQALNNDVNIARMNLKDIHNATTTFDRYVIRMEDALFNVHEEVANYIDKKESFEMGWQITMLELIKKCYSEFEPFIILNDINLVSYPSKMKT